MIKTNDLLSIADKEEILYSKFKSISCFYDPKHWHPYSNSLNSSSQLAEMILATPELFDRFNMKGSLYSGNQPTRTGILDELVLITCANSGLRNVL